MGGYLDMPPEKLWTLHPYNSTLTEVFDGERAWLVLNVQASVPVHPMQTWPLYIMIEAAELKTYTETQVKQ